MAVNLIKYCGLVCSGWYGEIVVDDTLGACRVAHEKRQTRLRESRGKLTGGLLEA